MKIKEYTSLYEIKIAIDKEEIKHGDIIELNSPIYKDLTAFRGKYRIYIEEGRVNLKIESTEDENPEQSIKAKNA